MQKKNESIIQKVRIFEIYPFIDEERFLEIGGRLVAADCLTESAKFQSFCY